MRQAFPTLAIAGHEWTARFGQLPPLQRRTHQDTLTPFTLILRHGTMPQVEQQLTISLIWGSTQEVHQVRPAALKMEATIRSVVTIPVGAAQAPVTTSAIRCGKLMAMI